MKNKEVKSFDNKNQQSQRVYGCPCGKTYLSYPALFTHIKQKHDGKAPGNLIKPKAQKSRGRPKIHIDIPDDDFSDGGFNFQEEMERTLENIDVNFTTTLQCSAMNKSCEEMAGNFLNKLDYVSEENRKVLHCFMSEVKYNVDINFGEDYWNQEKPAELISIANKMCHSHAENQHLFPLPKDTFVSLVSILFRWMYKNKWTDHKLIKR